MLASYQSCHLWCTAFLCRHCDLADVGEENTYSCDKLARLNHFSLHFFIVVLKVKVMNLINLNKGMFLS